jgi:hypothetical protein
LDRKDARELQDLSEKLVSSYKTSLHRYWRCRQNTKQECVLKATLYNNLALLSNIRRGCEGFPKANTNLFAHGVSNEVKLFS